MAFKSRIKWVALFVLTLSLGSILVHLSMTKFASVGLVQHSPIDPISQDFPVVVGSRGNRTKRLWGPVKALKSLKPYPNPRSTYPVPNQKNNGFIFAKVFGGFEKIRSSICDLVTISRLLNATLVIPEIQETTRSKGISYKFESFSYLYDEEQFIASLIKDIIIVKSLLENLKPARKRNKFPTFKPKSSASPKFYIKDVLPKLKKAKAIGLILTDGGCLQSILPPSMSEFQRLRCWVGFHALKFRPEIQILGRWMVERLRAWGQPFLAYHPGLVRDTLAYHGCAELFQDVHTELIQYRRAQMIKQGIVKEELSIESHLHREDGSCPLMPEEVGLLIWAMGHSRKTIIYLAGPSINMKKKAGMVGLLRRTQNQTLCLLIFECKRTGYFGMPLIIFSLGKQMHSFLVLIMMVVDGQISQAWSLDIGCMKRLLPEHTVQTGKLLLHSSTLLVMICTIPSILGHFQ